MKTEEIQSPNANDVAFITSSEVVFEWRYCMIKLRSNWISKPNLLKSLKLAAYSTLEWKCKFCGFCGWHQAPVWFLLVTSVPSLILVEFRLVRHDTVPQIKCRHCAMEKVQYWYFCNTNWKLSAPSCDNCVVIYRIFVSKKCLLLSDVFLCAFWFVTLLRMCCRARLPWVWYSSHCGGR